MTSELFAGQTDLPIFNLEIKGRFSMESHSSVAVHSNAFNFGEFVSGGVDPRTGMYTCAFSLASIVVTSFNKPRLSKALISTSTI